MKITLDLNRLLSEGKITQGEYDKFSELAIRSTGYLAFNILIGFGVIAGRNWFDHAGSRTAAVTR